MWKNLKGDVRIRTKETLVQDDTREIDTLCCSRVCLLIDLVADAHEHQAEEEAREHSVGPVPTAKAFHVHDRRDGTEHERAASDKGHEDAVLLVEADTAHESAHVVHNSVDTGELAEKDHDVHVDECAASSRLGEEIEPDELLQTLPFLNLRGYGLAHAQELIFGFEVVKASDQLPHTVRFDYAVLVHQVPRTLRQEDHADKEDSREDN